MSKYERGIVYEGEFSASVASGGAIEGNRISLLVTEDPNEDDAAVAVMELSPTKARELAALLLTHADRMGTGL